MDFPMFEFLEERNSSGAIISTKSNVIVRLNAAQSSALQDFHWSRYPYWKTRELEGRENADLGEGVWPINHWRVQKYWGDPGKSVFSEVQAKPTLTNEIDEAASRFRLHHYFRIWNSSELKGLCRPEVDIRVALKVSEDWHYTKDGLIDYAPDAIELGSHAIPISQYNPGTDRFEFRNSWKPDWGQRGWGAISTEVFDKQAFDAWRLFGTGLYPPLKSKAGKVTLRWKSRLGGKPVTGFEVVDANSGKSLAWAFATREDDFLNIEEFFVWPLHRNGGLGRKLAKLIRETATSERLKLRAWISFADSEIQNRPNLFAAMKMLGLTLHESTHSNAGFVGTTIPRKSQLLGEPKMPSRPASMQERLDPKTSCRLFKVWYATTRKPNERFSNAIRFTGLRDSCVHYGTCNVSIPKSHEFGSIGSWFWKRWIRWNDDRLGIAKFDRMSAEDFWSSIRSAIEDSKQKSGQDSLVFIHGYNVSFEHAAIRAAQIGFDLRIPGVTAFFSWPSRAKSHRYTADEATIDTNEAAIEDFLSSVAQCAPEGKVHIIAHSMGNRGLLRAVHRIVTRSEENSGVKFGQVILAAPDVDVMLFKQIANCYQSVSARTTLYASPKDKAIGLSKLVHDSHRVGLTPPITVVEGIDTIEVPKFDLMDFWGHGYFAEAAPLLYDIFELIRNGSPPADRLRLAECETPEKEKYWQLTH